MLIHLSAPNLCPGNGVKCPVPEGSPTRGRGAYCSRSSVLHSCRGDDTRYFTLADAWAACASKQPHCTDVYSSRSSAYYLRGPGDDYHSGNLMGYPFRCSDKLFPSQQTDFVTGPAHCNDGNYYVRCNPTVPPWCCHLSLLRCSPHHLLPATISSLSFSLRHFSSGHAFMH